jgi:hypothetical protein
MAFPTPYTTVIRLRPDEWARVYRGLVGAAKAAERSASMLRGAGPACFGYIRRLERDARRSRALAARLGHDGEVAAHLGVRPVTRRNRGYTHRNPAREYLDAYNAEELVRREFEPRPGSWPTDSDPRFAAESFLRACEADLTRPDAASLRVYMRLTARWLPRGRAACADTGGHDDAGR